MEGGVAKHMNRAPEHGNDSGWEQDRCAMDADISPRALALSSTTSSFSWKRQWARHPDRDTSCLSALPRMGEEEDDRGAS